ncbi:LTA synthase family protein [Halomonas denitrificans]|nr:LTA synthase family protein [Halomonas denitrificans]
MVGTDTAPARGGEAGHGRGQHPHRPGALAALAGGLTLILALPVVLTLRTLDATGFECLLALLGTLGLVLVLIALHALGRPKPGWAWLIPVLLLLLVTRLLQHGVVDFSGAGFTQEFFLHLQGESVGVALQEYDRLARRGAVLLVLMLALVIGLTRRPVLAGGRAIGLVAALGGGLLATGFVLQPEVRFVQGWLNWNSPRVTTVDRAVLDRWAESGLVDVSLRGKHRIDAAPAASPKNLVVVYLESIGVHLVDQQRWPGLMPNLARLIEDHGWVDHLWASGYITIEGLTNSLCGTLIPFDRGSDSLAEGAGLAAQLPCLGDVLDRAGYRQVYLGGAGTGFAGKGAFLAAHGYDEVLGIEDWRERGLDQRPDTWGLADPDLLEQSLEWIERLETGDAPWNLTLLTIGTHLPGYRYAECTPYPGGNDRFLDAVHCTDQLLARWVESIRASGVLDDTVVVITADHHIFPSDDMQDLFGDGVFDRRLPMVVLGAAETEAAQSEGASYDLAPTVLDLLGVEHDAEFALGRSLSEAAEGPRYFVTRFVDFHAGRPLDNKRPCERDAPIEYPVDACAKDELLSVLNGLAASFSLAPTRLRCSDRVPAEMTIVGADAQALEVRFGGRDQAGRFIHRGRPVPPQRPGWYLTLLDRDGTVLARRYRPFELGPGETDEDLNADLAEAASAFVARLGAPGSTSMIDAPLATVIEHSSPLAWIEVDEGRELAAGRSVGDPGGWHLAIDGRTCRGVLGDSR